MNNARINSFRVNGPCDPTPEFGAICVLSTAPVGYSILRADGTIYDFARSCWETLPPSGLPTGTQMQALSRFAASGPLANQQYAAVPASVFSCSGIWFATFQINNSGSIVCQLDDYPCIPQMVNS
jgi:hypothetical protein